MKGYLEFREEEDVRLDDDNIRIGLMPYEEAERLATFLMRHAPITELYEVFYAPVPETSYVWLMMRVVSGEGLRAATHALWLVGRYQYDTHDD